MQLKLQNLKTYFGGGLQKHICINIKGCMERICRGMKEGESEGDAKVKVIHTERNFWIFLNIIQQLILGEH